MKLLKKNKFDFIKFLVISIIIIFYFFYIFSIYTWIFQERFLSEMITYISRPFAILVSGYMIQSAVVNTNAIKKNPDKKMQEKNSLTFSAKLTFLIVGSFLISVIFFIIIWYKENRFPEELMEYIGTPFITILPTYIGKFATEKRALDNSKFATIVEAITDIASNGVSSANVGLITDEFLDEESEQQEINEDSDEEDLDESDE